MATLSSASSGETDVQEIKKIKKEKISDSGKPKEKEVKPPKQQSGKRNVMSDGSVTSEAEPKKPAKKKTQVK